MWWQIHHHVEEVDIAEEVEPPALAHVLYMVTGALDPRDDAVSHRLCFDCDCTPEPPEMIAAMLLEQAESVEALLDGVTCPACVLVIEEALVS